MTSTGSASDIYLNREVMEHIGKSRIYAAALDCAKQQGTHEQTRQAGGMKAEIYRMPGGERWTFIHEEIR